MSSPNMGLTIPVPTVTEGPQYAQNISDNFDIIDAHNHTSGQGSPIPLSALSITQNLDMNQFSVVDLKSISLVNQISAPSENGSLYMIGNNLYWQDGSGSFNVQITSGGSVVGSSGTITGLPSGTASAAYLNIPGTFRFESSTNTGANLDCRNLILRNNVVSSPSYEVLAPILGGNISVTLPAIPAATKIVSMTNTGSILANVDADNSTIEFVANTLQVKNAGITQAKMANNSVGTAQLIDNNVTKAKLAALGQQLSASCGTFTTTSLSPVSVTNLSCTITTVGRPVMIMLVPDASGGSSFIGSSKNSTTSTAAQIYIDGGSITPSSVISTIGVDGASANLNIKAPVGSISYIDAPVAGTHTYSISASGGFSNTLTIQNAKLLVYEL